MIISYDKYFLVERDGQFWSHRGGWTRSPQEATRVCEGTALELTEGLSGSVRVIQEESQRVVIVRDFRGNTRFYSRDMGWVADPLAATPLELNTAKTFVRNAKGTFQAKFYIIPVEDSPKPAKDWNIQESELKFVRRSPVKRYASFGTEYWEILRDGERVGVISQRNKQEDSEFGQWQVKTLGDDGEMAQIGGRTFASAEEAKQFAQENIKED